MSEPIPVQAAYEAWAASYDSDDNATRDLDALALRSADLPLDGASVIELGAGTGKNTAYLAGRAREVLALDFSAAMLARARARVRDQHVRFVEHDITRPWPVPGGRADLVIGNLVLEHVAEVGPVFSEARRALRPGGLLYLCELHPFRQLRGTVPRYQGADGTLRVEAYLHMTADYLEAGLTRGFALASLAEPGEETATGTPSMPRLLQLTFERS